MSDFGLIQIFLYTRGERFKYSNNICILKKYFKVGQVWLKNISVFFLSNNRNWDFPESKPISGHNYNFISTGSKHECKHRFSIIIEFQQDSIKIRDIPQHITVAYNKGRAIVIKMFTDADFDLLMLELDEPQIDGWEFFTESHGVRIYRLYNEVG